MFLTPRWLASHLFVIALVSAFVAAGFWQVDRLGERQDTNAVIRSRMGTVQLLADLDPADPTNEYRRVQATGRFDASRELLIANRSVDGAPGFWIWTVFELDGGGEIVVNRGFVPRGVVLGTEVAPTIDDASPTSGIVTVEGLIRRGDLDARVSQDRTQLTRPDAARAVELLEVDAVLAPDLTLAVDAQDPPRAEPIPVPLPAPDLGEGPHRSYAFQWFTFATIGVIGYLVLLARIARGDQRRGDVPLVEPDARP